MARDFSRAAKISRSRISVPDVPMAAILEASQRGARARVRAFIVCSAVSLGLIGTAAAFASNIYNGVQVWLSGGRAAVVVSSLGIIHEPQVSDVQAILTHATFPVVLPVGLPRDSHIWSIDFAPATHPNAVVVQYLNERTKMRVGFALFDASLVQSGAPALPLSMQPLQQNAYQWRVGKEIIVVPKRAISSRQVEDIRFAMSHATPHSSLAAAKPMLSRAIVLSADPNLGELTAEYTPETGRTVVLGSGYPATISALSRRNRSLIDSRVAYLTDIPSNNGLPDYAKATIHWRRTVALSPREVRAIDAVLQTARIGSACACALLFNQSDSRTYHVWDMPEEPRKGEIRKYTVDSRTLSVRRR